MLTCYSAVSWLLGLRLLSYPLQCHVLSVQPATPSIESPRSDNLFCSKTKFQQGRKPQGWNKKECKAVSRLRMGYHRRCGLYPTSAEPSYSTLGYQGAGKGTSIAGVCPLRARTPRTAPGSTRPADQGS